MQNKHQTPEYPFIHPPGRKELIHELMLLIQKMVAASPSDAQQKFFVLLRGERKSFVGRYSGFGFDFASSVFCRILLCFVVLCCLLHCIVCVCVRVCVLGVLMLIDIVHLRWVPHCEHGVHTMCRRTRTIEHHSLSV